MKKCPCCLLECKEEDFINSEECFRCCYKKKNIPRGKKKLCKICKGEMDSSHWVYCSEECSKKSQAIKRSQYWVWNMSYNPQPWN